MSLTNREIFDRLFEATVRIEKILYLGGVDDPDEVDHFGPWHEFLEEFDDHSIKSIAKTMPWLKGMTVAKFQKKFDLDDEEVGKGFVYAAMERGHFGFLIEVAHPVMTYSKGHSGASFSWGHYGTAWFYGETIEDALPHIEAWAADRDAKEKSKVSA